MESYVPRREVPSQSHGLPKSERDLRDQFVGLPPKWGDSFLGWLVDGESVMGVHFSTGLDSSSQEKFMLIAKEPHAKFSP